MKKILKSFKEKTIYFFKNTTKKRLVIYFGIFLLCIPILYGTITFSRYVFQKVYDNFLLSKEFYFYSDSLGENDNERNYEMRDWNGESSYSFSVDVKNYIDALRWTKENIHYDVDVNCDPSTGNVTCTGSNGIINTSVDGGTQVQININMVNNASNFTDGDFVDITVRVSSTTPYSKTLSAKFRVYVVIQDVKFIIIDTPNQKYFDVYLSNYGDTSKDVRLGWNPLVANIDTTNTYVKTAITGGDFTTTTTNGYSYLNSVTFPFKARKSEIIRFYKIDATQNYSYTGISGSSPITVQ